MGEFERPLWVRRWAYLNYGKSGQPIEVNVW